MFTPASREQKLEAFGRLLDTMDELRAKCPWDRKQTFETLRPLTIEETYELADAILQRELPGIEEEVGDVLLHLVFYALLGQEAGAFDIASVIHRECDKLVVRHPHIYGGVEAADEAEVRRNWEQIKLTEAGDGRAKTVLGGVPRGLPALVKATRMQQKTAQFGFEWDEAADVFTKVEEEIGELREAVKERQSAARQEEEFGDVLFSLVNYARFINVDPETALERANQKFRRRFDYIEARAPRPLAKMSLAEMDVLWNEAKAASKG